jgi:PAS domain S-box-containing protein
MMSNNTEGAEMEKVKEIALYETLINSMSDFIFGKDIKGRYQVCNDAFAELFVGKPKSEIIGKTDRELFGKNEESKLNFILEKDKKVFDQGEDVKVEWEAKLSNGKNAKLETIKTQFKDGSGKLIGLVGVTRDITERTIIEDELKEKVRSSEILNRVMVDREIKMIELKKELAGLKGRKVNDKT